MSESNLINVDSAMAHVPAGLDTTVIIKDQNGTPLSFRQYMPIILKKEGMIYREKNSLRLQRFTKSAIDSLERDNKAIARPNRWVWYRNRDSKTINDCFKHAADIFAAVDSIIVFKNARIMYLRKNRQNIFQFNIDLGRNPVGDKISEGDNRTPEGVYYLDNKWERNDKYYKSFWISYPNKVDIAEASMQNVKPGIGVMIHGTPDYRKNAKDWTNGCIALQNKDMDTLFKYVLAGTVINIKK
jgi:lipoprotein-anchoring transpeptidase ErfK/SrfK